MSYLSKGFKALVPQIRAFSTAHVRAFKINDSGNFCPGKMMPENVEELGNAQRTVANMDRSREYSGQQTSQGFSTRFMADQFQIWENADKESLEITLGYDMDGNAQLASVLQTNVPEPFSAFEADKLKEGVPEGLSDTARERGQRWAMEDRLEYQQ